MSNGRPSRAGDYPRITFHTQDRTFDRLLKESSLSELKKTVRTKLGLKSGTAVQLAQLRDWKSIDLEDEEDFDAFYSLAYEQRLVAVKVTLADDISAEEPASALEERPRKKHKRKHEAQASPGQEAESHVENHVSFGKKRKVAFTEPSAEIDEPTSSLEEPQTKKKKDDSSSIAAVAEPDRGSSHDSSEAPKKKKQRLSHGNGEETKKRKRKSTVDSEADDGVQSSTPSKHHHPNPGFETSHMESKTLPGADIDQLPSLPEHSTDEQEGPIAVEASATRSKKKGAAPTESSTLEEFPGVSVSSTTKTSKKKASRRKPDHANEAELTHPPVGSIDDSGSDVPLASSRGLDGAQKDDNLARNVGDKDGYKVLDNSKGGTKNRKRRSTVNANNTKTVSNIGNGQIRDTEAVPATAEKSATNSEDTSSIVKTKVTKKKKSTVASLSLVEALDRAVTNNTTEVPEDGAKKSAGPLKASTEASTICLVCNKTQKHELVDCPIVEEGPASIQKRIKSLRARKIPEHEKLSLISELQKIKAEQRESEKRKAREAKNVAIEPRSQSAPSPSADEGTKDVGGHTKNVAGVSKESRPVNQSALCSGRSSGPPSDETLSLDTGTHPIIDTMDNNGSITLPDIGDIPGLANVDLDVLIKGPESSFLSINDMPSSDDDSEEEEKMSGEPESEEVEEFIFAKLMRDDSSDSDTNDSQGDEIDESEKHVVGSSRHTQPSETNNSSGPKHSEDGDPGDSGSDVNAVRDAESTETTGLLGGKADDIVPTPIVHSSSPNPMNTSEEQQNMNDEWGAKQDPLEGVSSNEEPPRPRKGREESSSQEGASSRWKHVKAAKTKKTDGVLLSQVSKELEESAARNPKTSARAKNKLASNTSNRPAAKLAADAASAQRLPTSVDNWTALEELSSHPDDDGSILVDELLPSSSPVVTRSQPHQNKKLLNGTASKDDISEPPNSQPSLPLSQKIRLQDPIEDAENNSEKEAKDGDTRRRTRNSRYRRLSEIRSESIHKSLQVPRMTPSAPRDKVAELYGRKRRANEFESEPESSSDSDSEVGKQSYSHIPKKRVAGMS